MPSLSELREALATTITDAIEELTGYEVVPEGANPPAFIVVPRSTDFQRAFGRGLDAVSLDVLVLVSRRDDALAQYDLDPFVSSAGTSSIREAIWNNRTLGIADIEATVTSMTDYGQVVAFAGTEYLTARLTVEVLTSGTD